MGSAEVDPGKEIKTCNGGGDVGNDEQKCRQKTKPCKGGKVGNEQWQWRHQATEGSRGEVDVVCVLLKEKLSISDLLEKT